MNGKLRPYFNEDWPAPSNENVAYIPVRVTKEPRVNGSITVFLPDGTALDARAADLLRLDPDQVARTGALAEQAG